MNVWTEKEDKVLSNTSLSYDVVAAQLPNRSQKGIWQRAHKLGFVRNAGIIAEVNSENQRKKEWETLSNDKKFCEVTDGELLGDGCIFRKKVKNRNCYEYTFIAGSIHKEYAEYVHGILAPKLKSKAQIQVVKPNKNKKSGFPTNKPFYSVRFSSVVFRSFYERWYPNGSIKTSCPTDLALTSTTCLHWYLGDGSINNKSITLYTDNFKQKYAKWLLEELSDRKIFGKLRLDKKQYSVIKLGVKDSSKFLKFVGVCPVDCFLYKWRLH